MRAAGAITACMALNASFGLMGRRMKAATRTTRSTAKAFSIGPMASSTTACGAVTRCKGTILHPNGAKTESLWEDGKQLNPRN